MKATIFNIQSFSLHDGPGIRTTIFFKGCPLKCLWCHNPESHSGMPELFFYKERCVGCGKCARACPYHAIYEKAGGVYRDRKRCQGCGQCAKVCFQQALEISGDEMEFEEIMSAIRIDRMFYETSGGGVTFSGGEPLLWPDMIRALADQCHKEGIHTAIETSGYGDEDKALFALGPVDLVLFDLKAMDPKLHRELTGVSNDRILETAKKVCHDLKKEMVIRIPVIPSYNDGKENLRQTAQFIRDALNPDIPVHLLPYHSLGNAKAERLERRDAGSERFCVPEEAHMEKLRAYMESFGLRAQIGGAM